MSATEGVATHPGKPDLSAAATHGTFDATVRRPARGRVVITIRGEVDLSVVPRLEDLLKHRLVACTQTVVVDLSAVTFLDCAGIELLCQNSKRAEAADVAFRLVYDERGHVARMLALAGVERHFVRCESVSDALHETGLAGRPRRVVTM